MIRQGREVEAIQVKASEIRQLTIKMLAAAGSGHPAGSLGVAEIMAVLYFSVLNINPKKPNWSERDRLILSSGHTCPALYASLALRGFFPVEDLLSYRRFGSPLQGHPHHLELPGLETTSGLLGQGLSQAAGMALVAKREKLPWRVYVVMSDGEQNEGAVWESAMFGAKYKLDNLAAVIDRNGIQISGTTQEVMPTEPLKAKYQAFGWNVLEVSGNSVSELLIAFKQARATFDQPSVIIAQTTPGKGVDFMENKSVWHGQPLNEEEARNALAQLSSMKGLVNEDK